MLERWSRNERPGEVSLSIENESGELIGHTAFEFHDEVLMGILEEEYRASRG